MALVEEDLRVPNVLEGALRDRDPWVRYYACQSLGRLSVDRAVEAMAALLADDAPHVRLAAIEALSHVDSPVALDVLRDAVASDDADMKRAALVGLGIRGRKDVLPMLIEAAKSSDISTRLIAVSAINDLSIDEANEALAGTARDAEESVRNASIEFLSKRSGLGASKALIEMLDRPEVADAALTALARPAEGRVALLFSALEQARDEDRARKIAATLVRMKRPEATHALFHALGAANAAARRAAAITLSALGTKEALAAVRHASIEDSDPEVRKLCALLAA
jgi:HEAT repeat protein